MIHLATELTQPQSVSSVLDDLMEGGRAERPPESPTGFDPLDRVLGGGLRDRDLILIGGGPGVGKTVIALQWARSIARYGRSAIFACYEHDEASLFVRLVLLEAGELAKEKGTEVPANMRATVRSMVRGETPFTEALAADEILRVACARVAAYADDLWVFRASGSHTGLHELDGMLKEHDNGGAVLFVDYLQKVPAPSGAATEEQRVARVTEGLKEIALQREVPVVAAVAGDLSGLNARRLRMHHLRGSSALAYEADVVIMINDKYRAVSSVHTAYDPVRAEAFRSQVVITVEKNRDGDAPLDLEFTKDFDHYRFDPVGGFVGERLVDDHFYTT